MTSTSDVYFYVLFFLGCHLYEVIAKPDGEKCCCDEKKSANIFELPSERVEFSKSFNYSDIPEDIFRKISNDSDIIHTAETLDKGYYTSLCWSEIITLTEMKNGTDIVSKEYAITFETKSDIPDKYIRKEISQIAPEYKQYQIFDQTTKKSQIVNFTTISRNDEATVRQSRKMFCGSGPIYTKEFTKWTQSDRKRVEIKVSPKKQNLFAKNLEVLKTNGIHIVKPNTNAIEVFEPNGVHIVKPNTNVVENFDTFNKPTTDRYFFTSKAFNTDSKHISRITPSIINNFTPKHSANVNYSLFPTNNNKPNNPLNYAPNDKSSEGTLIYATNPLKESILPNYSISSESQKGKVQKVGSNPNLADGDHNNQNEFNPEITIKYFDQKIHPVTPPINAHLPAKEFPQNNSTTPKLKGITLTTRTVMEIISNSDPKFNTTNILPDGRNTNFLSTISLNNDDVTQTPLLADSSTIMTTDATVTTSDYDDDFSDELGEIKKDVTKPRDHSTSKLADKFTTSDKNVFATAKPNINLQLTTKTTMDEIPDDIVGFGGSVNRIAYEDLQNSNDNTSDEYEIKPDTFRNSTEIVLPKTDLNEDKTKKRLCNVPNQQILVRVKISMDYNLESADPSHYYSYSFPIMALEKKIERPVISINEIPKIPDEIINLEWSKFIDDLSTHFVAFNSKEILSFTQLVSQYINSTTPESELNYQILPEETVKRLQGIKDYLKLCKILNNKPVTDLGVIPEFRFSDELGQQVSMNQPNYGFYNYFLSPQYSSRYTSNNNYPAEITNDRDSYNKDYSQATFNQLLNLRRTENYPELLKNLQMYYYLPQQLRNRNWSRNNPLSPSTALSASSSYNNNYRQQQSSFPKFKKEATQPCPGCKTVNQMTSSLDQVLTQLQSYLQTEKK